MPHQYMRSHNYGTRRPRVARSRFTARLTTMLLRAAREDGSTPIAPHTLAESPKLAANFLRRLSQAIDWTHVRANWPRVKQTPNVIDGKEAAAGGNSNA